MTLVKEIIHCIENFAPVVFQENYDNTGLQVGSFLNEVTGVILALDVTELVIDEAIQLKSNLIISHHPLIFRGIKNITENNYITRIIIKAVKHDISIYSCHTNIDNCDTGVNRKIAEKLGLQNIKVLKPNTGNLCKLVFFVPTDHAERLRKVIFEVGAGHIGKYDCCSFNSSGSGTFRASEQAKPFVGEINKIHTEPEIRIETIFPKHLEHKIISAMVKAHPYEEVAYDIYPLANSNPTVGAGAVGSFVTPIDGNSFLSLVKRTFQIPTIRHSDLINKPISKVALCGGSGSFLLDDAIQSGAEAFITSDIKYHQFFDSDQKIIIVDIGHYESEQYTLEIFYDLLMKNFSNFAIYFTKVKTNPINYF